MYPKLGIFILVVTCAIDPEEKRLNIFLLNEHSNKIKLTSKPKSKNYWVDFFSTMYLQGIFHVFLLGS